MNTVFNFSTQNYSPQLLQIIQFHVFPFNHSNQNVISAHALRHILFPCTRIQASINCRFNFCTTAWRSAIVERNLTALKFVVSDVVKAKKKKLIFPLIIHEK